INASSPSTFDGIIQNGGIAGGVGGRFTKTGASTVTLTGANTYTGATTISAGTLALSGSGSLLSTGSVVDNATFDISQATSPVTIGPLSGSGTVALGSQSLTAINSGAAAFSGQIQDGGIGGG